VQPVFEEIVGLTDGFCKAHLNEEYGELSRTLAMKLARKRPSPLLRGRADTWACAIVYTIGKVNFLFDKTQTPHMRADELCRKFGVSSATVCPKSKMIRDLFGMIPLDPRWCLPSKLDDNLLAWLVLVNGIPTDARTLPREVQEELVRLGMIPRLPSHPEGGSSEDDARAPGV